MSAEDDDLGVELGAVFDEEVDGPAGVAGHGERQVGMVQAAASGADVFGKGLGRVLDPLLAGQLGVHGAEVTGGDGRIAAEIAHLFQDDDLLAAVLLGRQSRTHTGQTGADDDDVKDFVPLFLGLGRRMGHPCEGTQRHARGASCQKGPTRDMLFCHMQSS